MSVTIESFAFDDVRFFLLAEKLGLEDVDTAIGKIARVWKYCTNRCLHCLTPVEIALAMRFPASDAGWVAGVLLEVDLAAKTDSELLYIRGTEGRIEWHENKKITQRDAARLGGTARANSAKRDISGKFLSSGNQQAGPAVEPATPAASLSPSLLTREVDAGSLGSSPSPEPPKRAPKGMPKIHPNRRAVTDAWQDAFLRAYGEKPQWGKKELAIANTLAGKHELERVKERIARLFTTPPDWLKGPYTIGTLSSNWDSLVGTSNGHRKSQYVEVA